MSSSVSVILVVTNNITCEPTLVVFFGAEKGEQMNFPYFHPGQFYELLVLLDVAIGL